MLAALIPFAYLMGSVPWGVLLVEKFAGLDIRAAGSGNIGATNVRRVAGSSLGAAALLLDMAKGWGPVALTGVLIPSSPLPMALTALAAFFGHLYPVFLGGRGGKGVATAAGCFLAISPFACLAALFLFALILYGARRVSVASMGAAVSLPLFVWLAGGAGISFGFSLLTAAAILVRHRENMRRLMAGTEPRAFG